MPSLLGMAIRIIAVPSSGHAAKYAACKAEAEQKVTAVPDS